MTWSRYLLPPPTAAEVEAAEASGLENANGDYGGRRPFIPSASQVCCLASSIEYG
jgi:hypothetical protein